MDGKRIRMSRISRGGLFLCVPMDHGISSGPIAGIDRIYTVLREVSEGGATCAVLNKGILKAMPESPGLGILMHASASTSLGPDPNHKVRSAGVAEAVRLGADGISVHVNIGARDEPEMLRDLGALSDEADEWGMPLLAMMYPRGENIRNPSDPSVIAHVARVGAEMGADIVKCNYTGDKGSFSALTRSVPVPVVIAGGPKMDTDVDVLRLVRDAMDSGAAGVAFGRNVFQHRNPRAITRAIAEIIFENVDVEKAMQELSAVAEQE
ncbi:MAG: 2-amino-3,7-dideoxy-D-threo-hept-6-ulosonate synthase [Nitrososphaeria archaeon]